ncbi:hypothetical protein ACHAW5_003226 [Stephanodiscus triporus]|uniref:Fe2OG dioxygenase domain-containing protein n=1 Tax=Stephanodiscus triporus TaxID=2934178 RepID=A0ABD3QZS4_9STRA
MTASYDDDGAGSTSSLFDDILSGGRSNLDEGASTSGASGGGFDLNSIPPFRRFRVLHVDPMRTSTTWFHHYAGVPELVAKASRLLGLDDVDDIRRWEEPQTVRYRRGEKFSWHLDALSPEEASSTVGAGQRVATLLVYLTDVPSEDGGATMFRDLGGDDGPLRVRPAKGTALLFFPAAGGIPDAPFDIRTLHCGEAVAEDAECEKWIAQLWLRQRAYKPSAPVGNEHRKAFDAIGKYCVVAKGI